MAGGASLARRIGRPWGPLIRGSLTARLVVSLVALVIVTCAVLGFATYTVLSRQLMASFHNQLQEATSRAYLTCGNNPPPQTSTSAWTSSQSSDPDGDSSNCGPNIHGQSAGTFDGWLTSSGRVSQENIVAGKCHLSAADAATLRALKVYNPPEPADNNPNANNPPLQAPVYTRTLSSLYGDYELTAVRGPGGGVLLTGLPLRGVEHTLRNVEIAEIAVFAVVVLLVAGTGLGLVRFSLRPLRRVATTATMVTELPLDTGEVHLPARVPNDDPRTEVGRVGAAFNRMLQHVESALANRAASETRLRRFAADASHELRTPLSAIRGYAELALRQGGPVPDDVTHALERVQSESARMSVLVDELLLLARLDAGRPLA
ncbi:MAG TPA: HAMP domain-containing sensor histidine kinase, partial [Streptosporangiaceae bacterium]